MTESKFFLFFLQSVCMNSFVSFGTRIICSFAFKLIYTWNIFHSLSFILSLPKQEWDERSNTHKKKRTFNYAFHMCVHCIVCSGCTYSSNNNNILINKPLWCWYIDGISNSWSQTISVRYSQLRTQWKCEYINENDRKYFHFFIKL